MPENRNYYVIADDNTKADAMTKQEILEALHTAVEGKTPKGQKKFPGAIREINKNRNIKLWAGNEAQYESATLDENTLSLIAEHNDLSDADTKISAIETDMEEVQINHDYTYDVLQQIKESVDENKSILDSDKSKARRSAEKVIEYTSEMQNIADGLSDVTESLTASCEVIAPYADKVAANVVLMNNFDNPLQIESNITYGFYTEENWLVYKKLVFVFMRNGIVLQKMFYFPKTLDTYNLKFRIYSYDELIHTSTTGLPVHIIMNKIEPNRIYVKTEAKGTFDLKLCGVLGFERK